MTVIPPKSDALMLGTLADWFDAQWPNDPCREVQLDLLRIAERLRALDGEPPTTDSPPPSGENVRVFPKGKRRKQPPA